MSRAMLKERFAMTENPDGQRELRERLDRLASRYVWQSLKDSARAFLGAVFLVVVLAAIFADLDNPGHVRVVAFVVVGVGVLSVLAVWSDSPSRRLRQIRQSRTRAARFIRAHLGGRTGRTRTEIGGCKVFLTHELKDELKSKRWWKSDSRIHAVLEEAARSTPLTAVPGLSWCRVKTFDAHIADAGPLLFVRWTLPDFGNVVVIGHADPSTGRPEDEGGSEEAVDEFEDGYVPERWLNGERVAGGIAIGVGFLLLAAFVVFVLPALVMLALALVGVAVCLSFVEGSGRSKR